MMPFKGYNERVCILDCNERAGRINLNRTVEIVSDDNFSCGRLLLLPLEGEARGVHVRGRGGI